MGLFRHAAGRRGGPTARQSLHRTLLVPIALLAAMPILAACGPRVVGAGELIADQRVYPGEAGPVVGSVARTPGEVAELWEAVGFSGEAPELEGRALVVVAGGEPAGCPWVLSDVAVEVGRVTLVVGEPDESDWHRVYVSCAYEWRARALAVAIPVEVLGDADVAVSVRHPWGETEFVGPISHYRPLWETRVVSADAISDVLGCQDALLYATTPDQALAVVVVWKNAASRAVSVGGFERQVSLPHPDVEVELRAGGYLADGLCTDVVRPGRPLRKESWSAVGGEVEIAVIPRPGADVQFPMSDATLLLRDLRFELEQGADTSSWRIEWLEIRDVWVGWVPG